MKVSLILLFFSFTIFPAFAQTSTYEITELGVFSKEDHGQAKVYLKQNSLLKEITISKAKKTATKSVWRVQIFMSSGKNARAAASSTRNAFVAKYPDMEASLVYPSPYFKVYAGVFKTRIEAESFRRKILGEYPKSRVEFVVLDSE